MKIKAKTNLDEAFAQLDAFAEQVQTVATVRALNKLRDQAQVAGLREIARIYSIGPRVMEQYLSDGEAVGGALEASITCKGKAFPLSAFAPRQTRAGVSVLIKGKRVVIPHAFIAATLGGRVFARGAYGGKGLKQPSGQSFGRFQFGRSRLPINQLFTFAPPDAFANADVSVAMQDRVDEQAATVLAQEIRFAARG